ncbi:15116_t:CDS:1 [Funneliformis caledonium]|uniref:15116_t:CDS:1 n=1 Tax=Funneliformis caledonium TaxID=1117310 RepID=A0A9N9CP86_9GLOM|nr:15116_t:CDS:1 [Funneliformis caledonium]
MVNIKVTYKETVRRFVLPTNNATWTGLEAKLRNIYNIPTSTTFTLSYVDEDGDVITLSTDMEFQEVLSSQLSASYIKFDLKFSTGDSSDGEDSNNEAWVFEGVKTPPQSALTVNLDNLDNPDNPENVSQKNVISTTNQEAQFFKIGSEESSSIQPVSLLYEDISSSSKKTSLDDEIGSFGSLKFSPTLNDEEDKEEKEDKERKEDKGDFGSLNFLPTSNYLGRDDLDKYFEEVEGGKGDKDKEDKGKHKEIIGESSSNNVFPSSLEQTPLKNQDNKTPTVLELADQFQKMLDQFKKDVVKDHKLAGEMMDQFLRSIVEKNIQNTQENQSQDNLQEKESQGQGEQQDNNQSREINFFSDHSPLFNNRLSQDQDQQRGRDTFFDDHPPLFFTRQVSPPPSLPGSFPVTQKSTPCPWASQARPESDSLEMRQNVSGSEHRSQSIPRNLRRGSRRRHRDHDEHREGRRDEAREEVREETRDEEAREDTRREIFTLALEPTVPTEPTEPDATGPYYEEIKTLNDMGFWRDEDQYFELLTLYEGNLDRVIEALLERQE